jgi:hypothetical protein
MSPSGQVLGVLSPATAFDLSIVRLPTDKVNYFLTVDFTVLMGAATFVIAL